MKLVPDKKLFTKNILTLLTISIFVIISVQIVSFFIGFDNGIQNISHIRMIINIVALSFIAVMWIIATPFTYLWLKFLSYEIGDSKITIRKGFISKTEQNIPFSKVTDFSLYRSLYDRFLGIGTIKIQTAGQGTTQTGYEGYLSGLVDWEKIHIELKKNLTQNDTQKPILHKKDVNSEILEELKLIRKILEEK